LGVLELQKEIETNFFIKSKVKIMQEETEETENPHMEIPEDHYLCPVFTKENVIEHGKPIVVMRLVATDEHLEMQLTGSLKDLVMALSFAMQKDKDFFKAVSIAQKIVEKSPQKQEEKLMDMMETLQRLMTRRPADNE
jgi:hypothetical protein